MVTETSDFKVELHLARQSDLLVAQVQIRYKQPSIAETYYIYILSICKKLALCCHKSLQASFN